MKHIPASALAALLILCSCAPKSNMRWTWENGRATVELSDMPSGDDWYIIYSAVAVPSFSEVCSETLGIEHVNGPIFKIYPKEKAKNHSLAYSCAMPAHYDLAPAGAFIVNGKSRRELPLITEIHAATPTNDDESFSKVQTSRFDIIPAVASVSTGDKLINLDEGIEILAGEYKRAAARLSRELERIGISPTGALRLEFQQDEAFEDEAYIVSASPDGISITSGNEAGAFDAVATIVSFLEFGDRTQIEEFTVVDAPQLPYRGYMLDVARNFTTKDNLIALMDELARFKVNYLHLHLEDDEGWRLEIEDFPELTSVGAHHGWEDGYLLPSYDCNFRHDSERSSNGFYTREDFVGILKHARSVGITIIPEIDLPGHSRAAVKAMEAYSRRTGTSDFLLSEAADTSVYISAQNYRDNVINVALESTYSFIDKVIGRISEMYFEAGVPFEEIHLGGDEVPYGAWQGSPACQALMQENGWTLRDLKNNFVNRVAGICSRYSLKVDGWQEMAFNMDDDKTLQQNFGSANVWNTIPEWGDDHIAHTLANRGYGVVLSNVNNTYLDLGYSNSIDERGHAWAGTMNPRKSFALNPFNNYLSARMAMDGSAVDLAKAARKEPALHKPENIRGVQAQLFSETIRCFDDVTYYSFPKALGVFERAWNARPEWYCDFDDESFNEDFNRFYSAIIDNYAPHWESLGIVYRLEEGLDVSVNSY